jgi:Trk K+ transport system NAD-binding subunit
MVGRCDPPRRDFQTTENPDEAHRPVSGHVIVCGLGKIGLRVLDLLRSAGLRVAVIDLRCDEGERDGVRYVRGDCRESEVLERAGIKKAQAVLVVTSDDLINTSAALAARRLNSQVRLIVRMFNPRLLERLSPAVTNAQALSVSGLTAPMLASTALTGEVLAAFHVEGKIFHVARFAVRSDSHLVGKRLLDVASEFGVIPVAHEPAARPPSLWTDLQSETTLQPGDDIVVCGTPEQLNRLQSAGEGIDWERLLLGVQWAGRLRRLGRVLYRALTEVDLTLKISGLVLLTVLVGSTLIYYFTGMATSLPDGLYRTISVTATGADMKADRYEGWQKIFVSVLRVTGAVLTAAFTAIFTNFLLRARLGGALEVGRIPDGGHVVVCGLGNVGFRVVEELLKLDERVVVIDRRVDNPFVATCRRLGVAVITGDATIAEVQRQARVTTARAVIVATSNDLANLETALTARELNPKQRVVMRLGDDTLAEMLREVADVRLALSLPELVAPAFVAALYGDRVESLFRVGRRMLAAVELAVQPDDPCLKDQTLRAIAIDYNVLPLAGGGADKRLQPGEVLVAIGALKDLERIFRRQPAPPDWSVQIQEVPPPLRSDVAVVVGIENGIGTAAAAELLQRLPVRVGGRLTRGQAEDLRDLLSRYRVTSQIVPA